MYCRMCGNKIGDTDHYCQVCGAATGYQEAPAPTEETTEIKEEIVFNPPYEHKSHFTEEPLPEEEEPSDPKEEEKDLKEFISDNEVEAQKAEETVKTGSAKENEFTWNIYQFPSSKKTEEAVFNWDMADFNQPQGKEAEPEPTSFEEEFFQEIKEDSNRIKEQNIDRFFTFNRKNEEFQELLDKEYEKINKRHEPELKLPTEALIREEAPRQEIHVGSEASSDEELTNEDMLEIRSEETEPEPAEATEIESSEAEPEALEEEPEAEVTVESERAQEETEAEVTAEPEAVEAAEPETEAELVEETEPAEEAEPVEEIIPAESALKAEHISEMAKARAQFFGEELIRDNESIKKKLESEPEEPETLPAAYEAEPKAELVEKVEEDIDRHAEEASAAAYPFTTAEKVNEDEQEEDAKHKAGIGQVLLTILAVILFVEIVILGIRFFAPDSAAAKAIGNTQTQIFKTISGWSDGINEMFSGNDSNQDEETPDDENTDQNDSGEETPSGEQPDKPVAEKPAPDPNPTADKNALITSQMGNNTNIAQVKANEALAYQSGKNYGQTDINNSKPITNNIWKAPESGNPVYYDEAIVGTVIAFDSQWIDYVNEGSKSVLELLKEGSEAYRKTLEFSKLGKVKETFKLLEIGEIRQGAKGFYVWVHEEIQIAENGATTDKKYNWIYYLEPADGKMQIVNYFKF